VTATVSSSAASRRVNSDVDQFLELRSLEISEGRRANPERRDRPGDRPQVNNAGVISEIRSLAESDAEVQILNRRGETFLTLGVNLPVEDVDLDFLERRQTFLLRSVEVDGTEYRMITRHIEGGGVVQVAQNLTTTNELLGDVRSELLVVGLIMSTLAAVVGWGIAQGTTRPLRRLTRRVEQVASTEDLSTPLALNRNDEIGRLSEEFDGLLKQLGASRGQQQRLVQDAAHELRTPLTSVRANIDFMERATNLDPADRQSTLASIKAELSELSSVLAEVVELATESRDVASFTSTDLASVADAALAQFALRSDRPIIRELATSMVQGDHATLVRAAGNLIGNADKYSPEGLPITVRVADGSLSVLDQGPGIEPENRARIFDRFYRSDRDRSAPGSGLGLAIVAKAAAEHGGTAWVGDEPTGAHVGFTIPTS